MKKADHCILFTANGEINKRGIAMAAHTVMAPLVANIRATTPATALGWLYSTITALYNMALSVEFVDALKLLYTLAGLSPLPDIEPYISHPAPANYFMLSCLSIVEELTEGG